MVFKTKWISYSSIIDFNNCSRLYYFKNQYRNPQTGNRVQLTNPYLSLGSAVHDAIDEIVNFSPSKRKGVSLVKKYEKIWDSYSGKKGGFFSLEQEKGFKKRGVEMLKKVEKSDLFLKKNLKKEGDLPKVPLLKNLYLVGSLDWVEILNNGNLHIIDFKTGRSEEKKESWQLPIYQILAQKNYKKKVEKLSYWYLNDKIKVVSRNSINSNYFISEVKNKALEIEETIKEKRFSCSSRYNRCFWCRGYESIISGKAEYVGTDKKMKKDLYFLTNGEEVLKKIELSNFLLKSEKEILKMRLENKNVKKIQEIKKLSKKEIEKTVLDIKKKLKNNLTKRELSFFVEELKKSG